VGGREIGGDHRRAAPIRGDTDPAPARGRRAEPCGGDVDELLGRRDALDPCRGTGRVDRDEIADESAGVRARCTSARDRPAPGQEKHRLSALDRSVGCPGELPPVPKVLAVESDHAGLLVLGEDIDQLGRLEVGLVAERDEARESQARVSREHPDLESQVAALGDEADRPARNRVRAQVEVRGRIEDPQTVRSDEQRTRRANPFHRRLLSGPALGPALAEPRADDDERLRARGERLLDGLLESPGRNGDDDELGRLRQLGQRAVGLPAQDLAAVAVDEVDRAAVLAQESSVPEPVAPLSGRVRGADDCDRAGVEEGPEVPRQDRNNRREMMRRWMSEVPSSISSSFASRIHFSTGYSRE
jgi:hypothetical protein